MTVCATLVVVVVVAAVASTFEGSGNNNNDNNTTEAVVWTPDEFGAFSVITRRALQQFTFPASGRDYVRRLFADRLDIDVPETDDLLDWLRKRPRTCAIVGNSGILNERRLGSEIDAHDVVLRFNLAPTTPRFVRDVGRRTTILLLNYDKAQLLFDDPTLLSASYDAVEWLWVNPQNRLVPKVAEIDSHLRSFFAFKRRLKKIPEFEHIHVRFLSHVWKELSNEVLREYRSNTTFADDDVDTSTQQTQQTAPQRVPPKASSGFKALLAFICTCTSVDLYGFGASADKGYGHYWDTRAPNEIDSFRWHGSQAHEFTREHSVMCDLEAGRFDSPLLRRWMPRWMPSRLAVVRVRQQPDFVSLDNNPLTKQRNDVLQVVVSGDQSQWLGMFACVNSILRTQSPMRVYLMVPQGEVASLQSQIRCLFANEIDTIQIVGVDDARIDSLNLLPDDFASEKTDTEGRTPATGTSNIGKLFRHN